MCTIYCSAFLLLFVTLRWIKLYKHSKVLQRHFIDHANSNSRVACIYNVGSQSHTGGSNVMGTWSMVIGDIRSTWLVPSCTGIHYRSLLQVGYVCIYVLFISLLSKRFSVPQKQQLVSYTLAQFSVSAQVGISFGHSDEREPKEVNVIVLLAFNSLEAWRTDRSVPIQHAVHNVSRYTRNRIQHCIDYDRQL